MLLDSISFEYAQKSNRAVAHQLHSRIRCHIIQLEIPPLPAALPCTVLLEDGGVGDVVAAAVAEAERLATRGWDGEGLTVQAEHVEGEPYRSRKSGASRASKRKTKLTTGTHMAVRGAAGPSCQRGRREKLVRGRKDISRAPTDCAPACPAAVYCHVSQSGKNIGAAATVVLNMLEPF